MKKIISLPAIMLMSLALGSTSFTEAYGGCNKYAHKNVKKSGKCAEDKKLENSIKKEYREIRRHFDANHNIVAAKAKLKVVDKKAKQFDIKIEKHEQHKNIAAIHEHSLKIISRHLHEHIDKYAHERSVK